jgi:hypothetical protein
MKAAKRYAAFAPRGGARARPGTRPPEEQARHEVARVLDIEDDAVVERRLVEERDVPERVGRQPDRERDEGLRECSNHAVPCDHGAEAWRHAEHEQKRRPSARTTFWRRCAETR